MADAEAMAMVARIAAKARARSPQERKARLAQEQAFTAKQEALASAREAQRVIREKQAAERQRKEREEARRLDARKSGEPLFWCYLDLGGVWSRRWLYEHIAYEVPDIMHAGVSPDLTCAALREGLEAVRSMRRKGTPIQSEAHLLVSVAAKYQQSKPKTLVPRHEALKRPELICPHKI